MSRLREVGAPYLAPSDITPRPDIPWTEIGTGKKTLQRELEQLYWQGIKGELENIVLALKSWQELPDYSTVVLVDETDNHIHGFDSFIDQVSQESRAFAVRYENKREYLDKVEHANLGRYNKYTPPMAPYKQALKDHLLDKKAEQSSTKIREDVRKGIDALPKLTGIQQRAWMLLQAAGFLDMEKMIEHRQPPKKSGTPKLVIPQLTLCPLDESHIPRFEPMHCPECNMIIRASMFTKTKDEDSSVICEDCYYAHHYGDESYVKRYKHSVLSEEIINPAISQKICHCPNVPRHTSAKSHLPLFPLQQDHKHIDVEDSGGNKCGILKLRETVALAKFAGLETTFNDTVGSRIISQLDKAKVSKETAAERVLDWTTRTKDAVQRSKLRKPQDYSAIHRMADVVSEARMDKDIPRFYRQCAQRHPFGDVHMALRVGPLVIENGVANTKGGALVTLRQLPVFHQRFHDTASRNHCLAVGGDSNKTLWRQTRQPASQKRYKLILKQIVGVPFTGLLPHTSELEVVETILVAASKCHSKPDLSVSEQRKHLDSVLGPPLEKLRGLIEKRVSIYLQSIAERLLDARTKLRWSATSNNCQTFCSSVIDPGRFEPLVQAGCDKSGMSEPLYAMSFVCTDNGYLHRPVKSKFDVPNGLVEEYLLKLHLGRHNEADFIDTLQEYWYDWGSFGGPLYRYQNLFPWDCTEAYGRYPTRCGDCNLAKHLLAFPFDSWSIIALHLTRDANLYAPAQDIGDAPLLGGPVEGSADATPASSTASSSTQSRSRLRNRLTVLTANALLTRAAAAMARAPSFQSATQWLHTKAMAISPHPVPGSLKLGGIHRAQPFSHYFDAGRDHDYFLAPWALLPRAEQIAVYESLRNGAMKMRFDVPKRGTGRFAGGKDKNGLQGFGGTTVAVGATMALGGDPSRYSADGGMWYRGAAIKLTYPALGESCIGGCTANCNTTCGSSTCGGAGETVSSCSSANGIGSACGGGPSSVGGGGGGCGGGE